MKRQLSLNVSSIILFLFCFCAGMWLAKQRPLWNDEIYTQIFLSDATYRDILMGNIKEGNTCPLYYLIQKGICDIYSYSTPAEWDAGPSQWSQTSIRTQLITRINSVVFMSLSVMAIFCYFARFYSGLAGVYSAFISLSSYMVWAYLAEARPYALWVFLTTVQSLLFMVMIREQKADLRPWKWLVGIHILLSLTAVFSLAQIVIISFLLWILVEKRISKYVLLTVVPSILCLFYYSKAPKYSFWFDYGPLSLICANIPKDRFFVFFIFAVFLIFVFFKSRTSIPKFLVQSKYKVSSLYFIVTMLMLCAASFVLAIFKMNEIPGEGFRVSGRYFVYLTPVGIIATTIFCIELFKAAKGKLWLQGIIILGLAFLLALRVYRTFLLIKGYYHLA